MKLKFLRRFVKDVVVRSTFLYLKKRNRNLIVHLLTREIIQGKSRVGSDRTYFPTLFSGDCAIICYLSKFLSIRFRHFSFCQIQVVNFHWNFEHPREKTSKAEFWR